MRRPSIVASALAALGLAAATIAVPGTANAQLGSGGLRTESVRSASGFGGGTIYMPSNTNGRVGAVVLAPGFTAGSGSYRSIAQDIAREGFVVFAIDTNSRMDQPDSRGRQIGAALQHLTTRSGAASMVDTGKLAVSGHSMGGGGAMRAASNDPAIKAAVPLQPWHSTKNWSRLTTPTMIIAAQRDTVASNSSHSLRFYNSFPQSMDKAYVEVSGASHMLANGSNRQQSRYAVAWLKRFLDGDTSQDALLCGNDRTGLSAKRSSCPFSGAPAPVGDAAPAPEGEAEVDEPEVGGPESRFGSRERSSSLWGGWSSWRR